MLELSLANRLYHKIPRLHFIEKIFELGYNLSMSILRIYTDGACSGNQNETNIGAGGPLLSNGARAKEAHCGVPKNSKKSREVTVGISTT